MDKQDNKLVRSVLIALVAGIALIYTLIMYHNIIFAVLGMSAVFLIAAGILTQNIITFITMRNKSMNVQIKTLVDDLSSQLENMSSSQAQIGKATYLYTKQTAKAVTALEDNYTESQEALYKNLTSLSNAQNKAAKLMIKYDQNNTMKLIATVKEIRNQLSETMVQGFDQIQPNNEEVVAALQTIVDYLKSLPNGVDQAMGLQLNNVAHELQNISNSIQRVQFPVQNMMQGMPVAPTMSAQTFSTPEAPANTAPITKESDTADLSSDLEQEEAFEPESSLEPVTDTLEETDSSLNTTNKSMDESDIDLTETNDSAEPADIDLVEMNYSSDSADTDVAETDDALTDVIHEDAPRTTTGIENEKLAAPTVDDPNKQLSADEIAALFAAAEPSPSKAEPAPEPEEEEPFTPTFTVVGKSTDELPEEISDDSEDVDVSSDEDNTVSNASDLGSDPNKQLSPEEIAALFAAADPAPKKPEKPETPKEEPVSVTPVSDDPNKQLSPDEIAALFAAAEPAPKAEEPVEVPAAEQPVNVTPVSDDPNKQLSPEEIAALFAQMG